MNYADESQALPDVGKRERKMTHLASCGKRMAADEPAADFQRATGRFRDNGSAALSKPLTGSADDWRVCGHARHIENARTIFRCMRDYSKGSSGREAV